MRTREINHQRGRCYVARTTWGKLTVGRVVRSYNAARTGARSVVLIDAVELVGRAQVYRPRVGLTLASLGEFRPATLTERAAYVGALPAARDAARGATVVP